jgi:hypothetical protein
MDVIFNQAGQTVGTQINSGGTIVQEDVMEVLRKLATNFLVDDGETRPHCIHCKASVLYLADKTVVHMYGCPVISALNILGRNAQ